MYVHVALHTCILAIEQNFCQSVCKMGIRCNLNEIWISIMYYYIPNLATALISAMYMYICDNTAIYINYQIFLMQ